jgi:hypothetical protein
MSPEDRKRLAALRRHYKRCEERGDNVSAYEAVFLLRVIDALLAERNVENWK